MKTKLLLFALALTALSCSNDEQPNEQNCNCGTVISKIVFTIPNNTFTKLTIQNNCTHEVKDIQVSGNQGVVGQEYCE